MMDARISRKDFFRYALGRGLHLTESLLNATRPDPPAAADCDAAFAADLAPELLAFEAERLGLDPADKPAIVAALNAEMNRTAK